MALFVGTDIGGTFTDIVSYDSARDEVRFGKALTDYGDLVEGVLGCLGDVAVEPRAIDILKHGTTQVINVLLERKGAKTALVTTEGFRDVLEIGRAGRPLPFDLDYARLPPLVKRSLRFEVAERIDAAGTVLVPLEEAALERLAVALERQGIEALAISFINAYRNPAHEEEAARFFRARLPQVYVSTGSELSREWYEYERGTTAAANAYVGPRAAGYIDRFDRKLAAADFGGRFFMMASNGGVLSTRRAKEQPVALVESGPVGGCIGAGIYAEALGLPRLIAFDMGGTTAKCALVEGGQFDVQPTYYVGSYEYGFPLRTPVLDIVEVGTGGGSIAHLDAHGRMHVGPKSAGSDPGPVAFRRGGTEPTVTDANLALDRIASGAFLSGHLDLDRDGAVRALRENVGRPLGFADDATDQVAGGVLALALAQMASAIKEVTVERGKDTRDFALFVFGGGGPLHGVDLARELRIGHVVVPPEPGNFSALGMLFAPARIDETHTFRADLDAAEGELPARLAAMEAAGAAALKRDFGGSDLAFERRAEMRYKGQRHSIGVPLAAGDTVAAIRARYLESYARRYGRADPEAAIEFIGLRVTALARTERPDVRRLHRAAPADAPAPEPRTRRPVYYAGAGARLDTPIHVRDRLPIGFTLTGPAVIEEFGATTVIGPGDRLSVGTLGELRIDLA
jgi:N-methylhydantoinase A